VILIVFMLCGKRDIRALQNNQNRWRRNEFSVETPRRDILRKLSLSFGAGVVSFSGALKPASSAVAVQDSLDVEEFLRKGVDTGGTMGVSSQAGKSRPETGVYFRDGSELSRNRKTGDVNAEIIVNDVKGQNMAVFVSYSSPWPLAEGPFYDIECRNQKTSDGAFVQVTSNIKGQSISDIDNSFFLENLLAPTGRFSFYGQPTDVKIKKSVTKGEYKVIDLSFATLSQATQTEIPRRAQLTATIPKGSSQAIMLIGSAPASRWKNGSDKDVHSTVDSFRAIAAPNSSLKLRRKKRNTFSIDEN